MNKKLIALAIASAFAAPGVAMAQGSSVVIYGTLNADFENVEADDTDTGLEFDQRNRVSCNSCNLGFRGTEDLGNGLKAIFQIESSINLDSGNGNLGGRNSNVGLSGPWGTVFYGLWDTPYKFVSLRQDAWYATGIAANSFVIGTPGFGVATATQSAPGAAGAAANASFDRRQGDSVQYWTPSFNGLSGRVYYSANENKSADGVDPEVDPFTYGFAVIYENGPLYLNFAAERHEDYYGLASLSAAFGAGPSAANDASEDTGYKAGIGYTFGNTTLHAVYERLDYEVDTAVVDDFDRDAVFLALLHKIGAWTIRASYGHAFEADFATVGALSDDDTDADFYSAGASYSFSKRTEIYGLFVFIDNGDNASYNFGVNQLRTVGPGPLAAGQTVGLGAELRGVALGIKHSF
ncbi:MAG: porin [Burkholderiales bacterium]